jgi:myosin-15
LLDEECLLPAALETRLRTKFDTSLPNVAKSAAGGGGSVSGDVDAPTTTYVSARGSTTEFDLRHFAGVVRYDVVGWLDKNRDALLPHVELLMLQARNAFLRDLFLPHVMEKASDTVRQRTRLSLASAFRAQLLALLSSIARCGVWHVRCVSANGTRDARLFDAAHVTRQLRQTGVLETVRVRRTGFALRRTFAAACRRYVALLPPPYAPSYRRSLRSSTQLREPEPPSDARGACVALLAAHLPPALASECVVARTKLFLSAAATKLLDEKSSVAEAERRAEEERVRAERARAERQRVEAERRAQLDAEAAAKRRADDEAKRRKEEDERRRKAGARSTTFEQARLSV